MPADTVQSPAKLAAVQSPAKPDPVRSLARIVTGMSRFLTRFSALPAFEEAGIGLAEWTALSTISGQGGLANQQLANLLGVSAQRANQICEALRRATLVNISVSPVDARKKVITITPAGSAQLRELNSKLQALIQRSLNARPKLLARADAILNRDIMAIVLPSVARKAVGEPSWKER